MYFRNRIHEQIYLDSLQNNPFRCTEQYLAALYILTSDKLLWRISKAKVKAKKIRFNAIKIYGTLDIYSHVTNDMQRKAAERIENKIGRKEPLPAHLRKYEEAPKKEPKPPQRENFEPYKGKIRRSGSGGLYQINDHLWEGRFTPTLANGKRHSYNVYAKTRDECEALLEEMIIRVKAEIEEEKQQIKIQEM